MNDIQFGRYAAVTVFKRGQSEGTLIRGGAFLDESGMLARGLRITFRCLKDVGRTLNNAEIFIYGLNPNTRNLFSGVGTNVILEAGYVGLDGKQQGAGTLFYGDVTGQDEEQSGGEHILHVQAHDSYELFRNSNFEWSFGEGYSAIQALKKILETAGIPLEFPGTLTGFVPDKPFLTGWAYSGNTKGAIEQLGRRLGLEFFMLDGRARFLIAGASTARTSATMSTAAAQARAKVIATVISPETGLIGPVVKHSMLKDTGKVSKDPTKTEERHGWRFKCLLNHDLQPGSPVWLQANSIPDGGAFRLDRVEHQGDTHGPDWYSECIAPEDQLELTPALPTAGGAL